VSIYIFRLRIESFNKLFMIRLWSIQITMLGLFTTHPYKTIARGLASKLIVRAARRCLFLLQQERSRTRLLFVLSQVLSCALLAPRYEDNDTALVSLSSCYFASIVFRHGEIVLDSLKRKAGAEELQLELNMLKSCIPSLSFWFKFCGTNIPASRANI
jgi:hypothetical protein